MKISSVNLSKLSLPSLFQFMAIIIDLIRKVGAEKLKISRQFNELLLPAFQRFDEAYKQERKSGYTDKINACNKSRAKVITSINRIIMASINDIDNTVCEAAKKLKILFNAYKGITKKTVKEQCAEVTNMLQSLNGKYLPDVKLLGLEKWVAELQRINNEIISFLSVRFEEVGDRNKFDTVTSKREIISAYRTICKLIEVYISTEGDADYADFVRNLNAIISGFGGSRAATAQSDSTENDSNNEEEEGDGGLSAKYPNAREWSADIDYQTCASGDIFFIVRNGVKEYYKLLDFGEVATFEPGMDDGGIWEKLE